MKEFIEKLIERLEEEKKKRLLYEDEATEEEAGWYFGGSRNGLADAIEIVNQLAEEYNNGWIPCSERLPEHNEFVIASVIPHEGVNGGHPIVITRFDMHASSWYNGIIKAWQPLPKPYKQNELVDINLPGGHGIIKIHK